MQRRQRGRNVAMMVVLVALVVLFFAITLVKLSRA
jgi:ABC-type transporter Mla subunit MlaD